MASVFVKKDAGELGGIGSVFLRQRQQHIHQCRFTGAGSSDNHGVAKVVVAVRIFQRITNMKVEVKRHLARSLEDGYRLSPCVFVTLSAGKIMQRSQMRKIQTRNLCNPRAHFEHSG